ncbi:MAG: hypothetical protein WD509_02640 [Candidatus Paceibacterota bacterium]
MKKKLTLSTVALTLFSAPLLVFAAPRNFPELIQVFVSLINAVIYAVASFAVLGFFWGLAQYILSSKDSAKIKDGRNIMVWGIIALTVIFSFWGILRLLNDTFLGPSGGSQTPSKQEILLEA